MAPSLLLPTLPSLLINRGSPLVHRDLSWVQFNERVLNEAKNAANPPLERLKFLGITSSNLDEFFMIRFSGISKNLQRLKKTDPSGWRRLVRIHANLLESVGRFTNHQTEAFEVLAQELAKHQVHLCLRTQEGDDFFELGRKIFTENILPHLQLPEPFTMSKVATAENLQLCVLFGQTHFFKIPRQIPWTFVTELAEPTRSCVFFLDDLVMTHLSAAFRITQLPGLVRITRDGDVGVDLEEEDTASIPDSVRSALGSRERGRPVRLQWMGDISDQMLTRMIHHLRLGSQQVFSVAVSMGLHSLAAAIGQITHSTEGLRYPALQPPTIPALSDPARIFERLRVEDVLLHHPYDSFEAFVNFIKAACTDSKVMMIEQTIYRMDVLSPVLDLLKKAARKKKIRVIIELRARFDELNNLQIAEELRQAGVEVSFGFGKLKLHAKVALVTRQEAEGTRLYTHLSTGNYNATTARLYTDLAVLTSHPDIGADARTFFDAVIDQKVPSQFKQLVSAPSKLHRRLTSLIEQEVLAARRKEKARIVAKVNALVDEGVIESLYKASQAGVQVDLIVRGACSLVPGVKGLSENIRVISIVDRFLEHSRIYSFASSQTIYLSSADCMPRNFFSRLELAFPILDKRIFDYLDRILLPLYFMDTVKAQELTAQGVWKKRTKSSLKKSDLITDLVDTRKEAVNAQKLFEALAQRQYTGTPLEETARNA
jgi:polyphosphate kinase